MKRIYTYRFGIAESHAPIRNLGGMRKALKTQSWCALGLFCNGEAIGTASLNHENWKKKYLHTDSVYLHKAYRKQGHGIPLYKALISCARKIGAVRLYSSNNLNKFSRRMWKEKLNRAGFDVRVSGRCKDACKHCQKLERFYINL